MNLDGKTVDELNSDPDTNIMFVRWSHSATQNSGIGYYRISRMNLFHAVLSVDMATKKVVKTNEFLDSNDTDKFWGKLIPKTSDVLPMSEQVAEPEPEVDPVDLHYSYSEAYGPFYCAECEDPAWDIFITPEEFEQIRHLETRHERACLVVRDMGKALCERCASLR